MRRLLLTLCFALATSSLASAQQMFNLYVGGVTPRAEDARSPASRADCRGCSDDVLVNDLDFLLFNISDFNTATVGGEYVVGLGDRFDASLGIGIYQRSVPSIYSGFTNSDGSEIEQTLKLRVIPFAATVRFLPIGRHNGVEPYIGAGVGVFRWRYSESGQWVDFRDNSIFRATYIGTGAASGPMILGGVRVPIGSWGVGGELRYQSAEGDLPADQNFAGTKIDLGGFQYLFSVNFRF